MRGRTNSCCHSKAVVAPPLPLDHVLYLKLKTIRYCDPSRSPQLIKSSCRRPMRYVQLKPNKRYFRWFYCYALDFWCAICGERESFRNRGNENRCDLYHRIINLIYNKGDQLMLYWILGKPDKVSGPVTNRNVVVIKVSFLISKDALQGSAEWFYDSIFH